MHCAPAGTDLRLENAFPGHCDAPESLMPEFWASALFLNDCRFKMNNMKQHHRKEIYLSSSHGHSGDIRKITDVNVNKLHQPWRSFAAVINKCLSGTPSYDSLRLSQAQLLGHEQKSGKRKQKTAELETISEAEQLKIITKRSRQETHSSHASGSGADEGTGVTPGVPDAPDYDSEDVISWKSSDDDQADEQAEDDEDAVQDDDEHGVDKTAQEMMMKSSMNRDVGDDFCSYPKLTTHDDEIIHEEADEDDSSISTSNDEDSDNEDEGTNVEGAKTGEEATYEEDQGNEELKALEDNFSELRQTNQYAEALSSIPSTVDQYLANKMQEAVDVAVQLKMEKIIKDQVKKKVSKIIPKVEKFVTDQLESEVLVRSSKEANTSHAVAANLSELELKKILIDKMETNNSINRDGADDDEEPSLEQNGERLPVQDLRLTENLLAQLLSREVCNLQMSLKDLQTRRFVTVSTMNKQKKKVPTKIFLIGFKTPTRLPSLDHAWYTSVPAVHETVLARGDERNIFCEEVYKATTEKLDWINPEGRQYPHDLRQPLPLVPNSQGRRVIPFHHFINNDLEYLRGGVSSRKYSTSVTKTKAADYGHIKWIEDLVPNSMWSQTIVKYDKFALWGISHWGKKRRQFYAFATLRESARDVYSKRRIIAVTKVKIVDGMIISIFDRITGKVTNLSVEERIDLMSPYESLHEEFVIQRTLEIFNGVDSSQKKLNLTSPERYRSILSRQTLISIL
ncbi:hypothetical protein Tco_0515381 [Tanacetum coccineum]